MPMGNQKWQAIGIYALSLAGAKRSLGQLGIWLNGNGMLTEDGKQYQIGGRGVATAVSCAYWYHFNRQDVVTADAIKYAFVDQNGNYAYDNY